MQREKSLAVAILLGLFLGPIGLLYGSLRGAILMTVIMVGLGFVPFGAVTIVLFPLCWLLCPYINVWTILRSES